MVTVFHARPMVYRDKTQERISPYFLRDSFSNIDKVSVPIQVRKERLFQHLKDDCLSRIDSFMFTSIAAEL